MPKDLIGMFEERKIHTFKLYEDEYVKLAERRIKEFLSEINPKLFDLKGK